MPTLSEVRAKYPMYGDMSDDEFADKFRRRFYSDIPEEEFRKRLGMPARLTPPAHTLQTPARDPVQIGPIADVDRVRPMAETVEEVRGAARVVGRGILESALGLGGLVTAPIEAVANAAGFDTFLPDPRESAERYSRGFSANVVGGGVLMASPYRAAAAGIMGTLPETMKDKEGKDVPTVSRENWAAAKNAADLMSLILPLGAAPRPSASTVEKAVQAGKAKNTKVIVGPSGGATAVATPAPVANPITQAVRPPAASAAAPVSGLPKYAGNINLNRINSEDGVKAAIFNLSEKHAAQLDSARRGTISLEETTEAARAMGLTAEQLLSRPAGQALNAEQALAARDLLIFSAEDLVSAAKDVKPGNYAEFSEKFARHLAIQEQVAGATAEAGRALSSFRIMSDAGRHAEGIKSIINAVGGTGKIEDIARMVTSLGDNPGAIAKLVREAPQATTGDKLYFAYINSLLSGPKTHAANIVGNIASSSLNLIESAMAEGMGRISGTGVAKGETSARAIGALRGLVEGTKAGVHVLRHGADSKLIEGVRPEPFKALQGAKGAWLPTRFLSAEDAVFRGIAQRMELNALAVRQARKEGLSGQALSSRVAQLSETPTAEMIAGASKAADYATFTKDLGETGKSLQMMIQRIPGLRFIAPFVRTPINLFKYAGERIPVVNLMSQSVRDALSGKLGRVEQQLAIARNVTGAGMLTTAALLWKDGKITGGGPAWDDPDRKTWLVNNQPFSFKIGDQWVSYARMEPFATTFGAVAGALDVWERSEASDDEKDKFVSALMTGVIDNLTSKTFLSGPVAALEAIMDPENKGAKYLTRFATSVVPTGVAQLAQAGDPLLRENRTLTQAFATRIPGMKQDLPPKIDLFGQEIDTGDAMGTVERFISPFQRKRSREDPVAAEMLRLGYGLPPIRRKLSTAPGSSRELSDDEYVELQKVVGQNVYREFRAAISHPDWEKLTDDEKRDELKDIRNDIAREARKQFKGG